MGLKIRLNWYDKKTEIGVGREYSKDFGDDASFMDELGIESENNINNGGFDVDGDWAVILQLYFVHTIELSSYDYQVSFDYRDAW
ncbi:MULTISPECIES: colicin E3-like toxin immunity protein [Pseudomonas]|uniref:Cloacin n=1 Tax=Pseudomonas lini TaxID=163011 RepID=A0A0J6HAG1_9PSED|nr:MULTISPECIES: colicin E3-like toxin immunity protein [Pseudomonas]KAB0505332.1 cloacin [Pseudomonas lini]KMM91448.1 cloacin [Pseudomonas lini]KNH46598.1 cloacin [Pseudomonas lini]MDT9675627.1 cloacin [Pseudomonas sp. JV414]NSX09233.1 cloacin [Pseudomonas lini]